MLLRRVGSFFSFVVEVHRFIMCFWRAWNLSKHFHCHGKIKTFHFSILTFSSTPVCRNQTFWSHMGAWSKLFFRRQSSLFMFTLQLLLFGFYFSYGYVHQKCESLHSLAIQGGKKVHWKQKLFHFPLKIPYNFFYQDMVTHRIY